MKRKLLAALLAALLTLTLAACNTGVNVPVTQTGSDDFQKNMHQTNRYNFIETDTGFYFFYGPLHYLDKETMKATVVCGKPDCDHTDPDICNAIPLADYLLAGGDKLYYVKTVYSNGQSEKLIQSVKFDATDRKNVQELKYDETSSSQSSHDRAIYHRGYIYYVSDDILYRVKLGGEKDSAEEIWKPENAGTTQSHGGLVDYNPNAIRYTLWAEGNTLYFMANVQTADGTYKDVLFQCDLSDLSVKQVWATPGKDEVGEWERTGVKVSQWYVAGGYIYFYLSGGDMWRTELASGKMEKLADTHEKAQYGSAVFSDEYMALLNDYPVAFYGYTEPKPGGIFRYYGDTIFIYGLDGTFVKEIPLKGLYDDPADMAEIDMLCCSGKDIFFLTTAITGTSESSGTLGGASFSSTSTNQGDVNLCHANIETGEVEVVCNLIKR